MRVRDFVKHLNSIFNSARRIRIIRCREVTRRVHGRGNEVGNKIQRITADALKLDETTKLPCPSEGGRGGEKRRNGVTEKRGSR